MSKTDIQETAAEPVVLEYGRYRLFETPDGGWAVARAVGTCETCQNCGCGEQADPIMVPGMVVKMARQGGAMSKLRAVMGRGS